MTRTAPYALAVCAALELLGCSGARSYVVAPTAEVPISMSSGMRGEDGELLAAEQKHTVGEFSMNYRAWGMLWKAISFTGDKDISDEINEQVKAAGGQAVTNLEVRSGNCMWNAITLLGLLPDCSNVEIRGDIIRVSARKRGPPPEPKPAAPPSTPTAPVEMPAPLPQSPAKP
jgi:hypothetical protein